MAPAPMKLPRFYPIVDTGVLQSRGLPLRDAAEALLEAQVGILQFRHKLDWTREIYEEARVISSLCRDAHTTFVINDRADIALLLDAAAHVGQQDLPPSQVRRVLGAERLLGYSTHNEVQLRTAITEPVDYLALGPIFGTTSKANPDPVVGVEELSRMRALTDKPLVAIGGITFEIAREVWAAGADAVAVVGDLYERGCSRQTVRGRAEKWMQLAQEYSAN